MYITQNQPGITTFSDIPRSVLALLLDAVGKPGKMSPRLLMGKAGTIGPREKAELYAGGFSQIPDGAKVSLTPQFVRAGRVLLNPRTNVNIRIWGNNAVSGETNIQFPGTIVAGGGVIFNQIGRMYRISGFVDDSTVTNLVGQAVPDPKEKDIQFEFKALLDNPVAAVLFAILDLARARAAKKPGPMLNMVFSTSDVYNYMYNRWAMTGFKELLTYVAAVGVMTEAPSLTDTVDGLRLLSQAGILQEARKDIFSLTSAIEPLARLTVGQPSGLQWQRVCLLDNGEQVVSNRLFLFGDKSLMLCLAPSSKGRIFISRVRRNEITDFLAEEITSTLTTLPAPVAATATKSETASGVAAKPPSQAAVPPVPKKPEQQPPVAAAAPPESAAASQSEPLPCINCGMPIASGKKFCAKCGTPVSTGHAAGCPNCKSPVKPGVKFCGKCGAALAQRTANPAAEPSCPGCGRPVKAGAKFCNSCGAKI